MKIKWISRSSTYQEATLGNVRICADNYYNRWHLHITIDGYEQATAKNIFEGRNGLKELKGAAQQWLDTKLAAQETK